MCKNMSRKKLYTCAKLYEKGIVSEDTFKECMSEYIIKFVNTDLYDYLNKSIDRYQRVI